MKEKECDTAQVGGEPRLENESIDVKTVSPYTNNLYINLEAAQHIEGLPFDPKLRHFY
jgi:hypothetical protein